MSTSLAIVSVVFNLPDGKYLLCGFMPAIGSTDPESSIELPKIGSVEIRPRKLADCFVAMTRLRGGIEEVAGFCLEMERLGWIQNGSDEEPQKDLPEDIEKMLTGIEPIPIESG